MKLMLGNEAIARGAYEAGVKLASAYPGTPSTEILEYISKYDDIYSEWAPNEKVSLEVALGAAIAGARSICAMKHVGLNVAADPLFTSSYTGINAGFVIVVADDNGMHSSQDEQDTRYYGIFAKLPVLEPSDGQECKDFIKQAFEISEQFDTPVIVKLTTRTSHSRSLVSQEERKELDLKQYVKNQEKFIVAPSHARVLRHVVEERIAKLSNYSNETSLNKIEWADNEIGIITNGISYQYVKEVFPENSILKIGMVHPLPLNMIKTFADSVEKLYIVEENEPLIENALKTLGIKAIGKELLPYAGEITTNILKENLKGEKTDDSLDQNQELPNRPPILCAGCPHRGLHLALKNLDIVITGDIGCYTLGAFKPTETMDTCLCMGASVSMSHGFSKAWEKSNLTTKAVGIIGDSTFLHTGIQGLIDIVYNKGTSTIIIADNSITAMTGHQHNPSTGYTIKNEPTNQIDLEMLVRSVGVKRIHTIDPLDVNEFKTLIKNEIAVDEPSVIIAKRPCALLLKNQKLPKYSIKQENCKKCNRCLSTGCPAIENFDNKVTVNTASCLGCGLCQKYCNFNALVKEED